MPIDDLRSALRKARENLSGAQREEAAGRCAQRARALPALRRARCIAAYMAHRGEISCGPIIEWALERGASVLLPVVVGRHMRFTPCHRGETLRPNRWGIPEPEWQPRRWVSAICPSVVLMPLVAFDSAGNRLGQGGGYYDRAFAFRSAAKHWRRPLLVGLAYEFQQVGRLNAKPTDVPLDAVLTEQQIHQFRR
ncbi:MAG: 5-formyltetrahydrofolate cyclo-ligase [Gammaproteobacteria bacterium]|nr:5-formyltetrahydrofolate cyclo-ligase [Gammaproteobacteria bacterium]MCY4254853.1 5-formyltetrahydrofolate cyclo-ligase [Gammaproteobacteria bacterium]